MVSLVPLERRVEVGQLLTGEAPLSVAADIFLPPRMRSPAVALFCLPGGAVAKGYFALEPDDFSFAARMTEAGFIVVSLDHLGSGASSTPQDGFELTPDVLTAANALAVDAIRTELLGGQVEGQTQPLSELRTIGVGHSMGAMLTAMQQARFHQHAALMLFGFSTRGLPVALTPEEAAFAANSAGARNNVVRLARTRSRAPNSASGHGSDLFAGENADRRGVEALRRTRTRLLVTAGLFSMIPGSSAPECAQIDTPIFLAVGDRDIAGPPHQIPANFPASGDVTLVVLPATGHCHFLFASRQRLFARAQDWAEAVLQK
jgi:pimeloyl-ACP methyl ester carboxylesterase